MREVTAAILLKLQLQRLGQRRYLPSQGRHWGKGSSRRYQIKQALSAHARLVIHHAQDLANVRGGLEVCLVVHDGAAQRSGVL